MALSVEHLLRTAPTLKQALLAIARAPVEDAVMFDLFRNAAIKSFELSLETAGKLIRKTLKGYGGSPRSVDARWSSTTCCATPASTVCWTKLGLNAGWPTAPTATALRTTMAKASPMSP